MDQFDCISGPSEIKKTKNRINCVQLTEHQQMINRKILFSAKNRTHDKNSNLF